MTTKDFKEDVDFYWEGMTSPKMKELEDLIISIADGFNPYTDKSLRIVVSGESGVGKSGLVKTIYQKLALRGSFEIINGNELTGRDTAASLLLGVNKGVFTGVAEQKGKFELANHGFVFLDEIHKIPIDTQAVLLGIVRDEIISRVGSSEEIKVKFQLVSGTNRDLHELVKKNEFLHDLLDRINLFELKIPPLRERKEDIIPVAKKIFQKETRVNSDDISAEILALFEKHDYKKGNLNELDKIVRKSAILAQHKIEKLYNSVNKAFQLENAGLVVEKDGFLFLSVHELYEKVEKLKPVNKKATQIFNRWAEYHLEENPEETLAELLEVVPTKISKNKFCSALHIGKVKFDSYIKDLELKSEGHTFTDRNNSKQLSRRFLDSEIIERKLKQMPKERLVNMTASILSNFEITQGEFDNLTAFTSDSCEFRSQELDAFIELADSTKYILRIFMDSQAQTDDKIRGYSLGNDVLERGLLEKLIGNLRIKIEEFFEGVNAVTQTGIQYENALNEVDLVIQQWKNGPLTGEYAEHIKELKNRLGVSYMVLGEMIEIISGSFLGNLVRYHDKNNQIMTSKANLLKAEIKALAKMVELSLHGEINDTLERA